MSSEREATRNSIKSCRSFTKVQTYILIREAREEREANENAFSPSKNIFFVDDFFFVKC